MADVVTSQTLVDGVKNVVMKFTNVSDSTGESAVTKVDVSALGAAPERVRIDRIIASTSGMGVSILWGATADVPAFVVGAGCHEEYDFRCFGGLTNNAGAGVTGDIKFTTIGAAANSTYTIILHMSKM